MADKELAAKLELRRAASLADDEKVLPSVVRAPSPPPPPPIRQQTPPFANVNREPTDIEKLISETLAKTTTTMPSTLMPKAQPNSELFRAPDPIKLDVREYEPQPDTHAAPLVQIIHHKGQKQRTPTRIDEDIYIKERCELEEKLARQRQIKARAKPPPDLLANLESEDLILPQSDVDSSSMTITTSDRETAAPVSPSGDSGICVRSPPPVAKKPSYSSVNGSSQGPVSPACSSTSNRSNFSDENEELAMKLARRNMIAEGEPVDPPKTPKLGLYSEFNEFSRKQIKYFIETFKRFDEDGDSFIDFNELKRMMEKLGEAQTHIALKSILKLVDEDKDGKVSLREFMLIFRYAASGQLVCSEVFNTIASSVDVTKEGVHGAANFFQAKIEELSKTNKFETEIKAEREERKQVEEEKKERRQQFLANKAVFLSG